MTNEQSASTFAQDNAERTSEHQKGLYLVLISVHGLIREHNPELGRDADTGGQITYVLELVRALAEHPEVARVDLLTRLIEDPKVSEDYKQPVEEVAKNAYIIRLPCGPRRYLRKEVLWPHLDSFADRALRHLRRVGRLPDIIHGHYADAGYVASRLAEILGVSLAFTGHSLGRIKRQRLLDEGARPESIEKRYNLKQRIDAEEFTLAQANFVVTSTRQEIEEQYACYDNYQPKRMVAIPPGTDLDRFFPPGRGESPSPEVARELEKFLRNPKKPAILTLARPDPRKNLSTLVKAYGEDKQLRELANLIILVGSRNTLEALENLPRKVITELLIFMDDYDLYGEFALPKAFRFEYIPELYRYAARTGGVFINPALTEPFGLTLIEAASSGLPVVATEDGGPVDIIGFCKNGILIDPLDSEAIAAALKNVLSDRKRWKRWSNNGIAGSKRHFSWSGHVAKYLRKIRQLARSKAPRAKTAWVENRLITSKRILICDIDNTLIGDDGGLRELLRILKQQSPPLAFGVATGRNLESTLKVLKASGVPLPDLVITSVGSEIHYGPKVSEEIGWSRHINYRWNRDAIHAAMREIPGVRLQPKAGQRKHKISYYVEPLSWPGLHWLKQHLGKHDINVSVIFSHNEYLDLLPIRASKGSAIRYIADKWELPLKSIIVVGDSGNDAEMMRGDVLAGVVGNYQPELEKFRNKSNVYFAEGKCAWGIIETVKHYNFLETQ